jgi:hypothetical protein
VPRSLRSVSGLPLLPAAGVCLRAHSESLFLRRSGWRLGTIGLLMETSGVLQFAGYGVYLSQNGTEWREPPTEETSGSGRFRSDGPQGGTEVADEVRRIAVVGVEGEPGPPDGCEGPS